MLGEGVRELTNPKLAGEGFLSRRPSHVFADRWPPSVASRVSDGTEVDVVRHRQGLRSQLQLKPEDF